MLSIAPSFTPLERAVLEAVCELHAAERDALRAQLATATVRSRENTGGGFFTHFEVDRRAKAIGGTRLRNSPLAKIEGLEGAWMGFILWLQNGFADGLEGYAYEGSTAALNLETAGFEIVPLPDLPPSVDP
ncbi:MAG TPA: hypothetical protein VG758_04375 [Hyphomicrobiaceae bacterium]|jgi:hypothetical protein|nr:hypothetical protein [Hyphomicrobiaceae bacterium]